MKKEIKGLYRAPNDEDKGTTPLPYTLRFVEEPDRRFRIHFDPNPNFKSEFEEWAGNELQKNSQE